MADIVRVSGNEDRIKISDEVIATIAGIAASDVENLASMSGGLADGIAGILGRKNHGKGIKVDVKDNDIVIEMSTIMQYGCRMHEVSREIQERVRFAVEGMTGMNVKAVNINILGVSVGKDASKVEVIEETTAMQA